TREDLGTLGIVDLGAAESNPQEAAQTIDIPNCGPCVDTTQPEGQPPQNYPSCRPFGIAVSSDGTQAYIARGCDNQISVLDLATRQFLPGRIDVGDTPTSIEVGT